MKLPFHVRAALYCHEFSTYKTALLEVATDECTEADPNTEHVRTCVNVYCIVLFIHCYINIDVKLTAHRITSCILNAIRESLAYRYNCCRARSSYSFEYRCRGLLNNLSTKTRFGCALIEVKKNSILAYDSTSPQSPISTFLYMKTR